MATRQKGVSGRFPLLILFGLATVFVLYYLLRFGGNWTGGDTVRMAAATRSAHQQGTIQTTGAYYSHGFCYQMVSLFILNLTGISLESLIQQVLPFLLGVDILVAYAAYSILTQDRRVALLGAFFLALQPEFLFTTVRGSHEKITWMLTLAALYLLARGFLSLPRLRAFAAWASLFYLVAFALVATNVFFASSFLAALALCFATTAAMSRLLWREQTQFSRLAYVTASCSVLVFLFMFYIYTRSLEPMYLLKDAIDKVAALFLNVEAESAFSTVAAAGFAGAGWVSGTVYTALSATTYLLALVSFVYWLRLARRLLNGQVLPPPVFLLWLFYAAFATQLVLSVGASGLGLLASNLQVRLFPVFMLFVMPLAAMGICEASRPVLRTRLRVALVPLALLFVMWAAGAALLKATNEPLLSNNWTFRLRAEQESLQWVSQHTSFSTVWLGLDRLRYVSQDYSDPISSRYDIYDVSPFVRYALVSRFEDTLLQRRRVARPNLQVENRIYTNGLGDLYQFRPATHYQR